ncbi:MAG: DNA cytosine methyltransferase [Eggerthella lenta]
MLCLGERPGSALEREREAFRCLLRAMDEVGYGLAWRILDAQFFGLAQRRERVFLVGVLGSAARACEVLFEPHCMRWDHPPGKEKRALRRRSWRRRSNGRLQYPPPPPAGR